jgi:hypothetical protein
VTELGGILQKHGMAQYRLFSTKGILFNPFNRNAPYWIVLYLFFQMLDTSQVEDDLSRQGRPFQKLMGLD